MDLDLSDALQLYLYLFRVWEPSQSALVAKLLAPDDLFVDVGAHVGYYTLLATEAGAGVIAVEPDDDTFKRLWRNVQINGVEDRVSARQAAVAADEDGRVLYRGPKHNRGLTSTNPKWNLSASGHVPSQRLDQLIPSEDLGRVRIIKIDVEGAEPEILSTMKGLLDRLPHDLVIILELSPKWWSDRQPIEQVLDPIVSTGFRIWTIENSYSPLRYFNPGRIEDPEPMVALPKTARRMDLVMARTESALR